MRSDFDGIFADALTQFSLEQKIHLDDDIHDSLLATFVGLFSFIFSSRLDVLQAQHGFIYREPDRVFYMEISSVDKPQIYAFSLVDNQQFSSLLQRTLREMGKDLEQIFGIGPDTILKNALKDTKYLTWDRDFEKQVAPEFPAPLKFKALRIPDVQPRSPYEGLSSKGQPIMMFSKTPESSIESFPCCLIDCLKCVLFYL